MAKRAAVKLAITAWLCLLSWFLLISTAYTQRYAQQRYQLIESAPLASLEPRLLAILTLGHRDLYDDFLNIWALQMLVDERTRQQDPELLHQKLMQLVRHRPRIESLYMIACFVFAFDFKRPDLCEPLTRRGLDAFPYGWRIPMTQGFVYAYLLKDPARAAVYYGLAATRPGAPKFLQSASERMASDAPPPTDASEVQRNLDLLLQPATGSRLGDFLRGNEP